ncbi:HD-GYP domain-containing protein [Natronincola ferrireducens]|uniref:Metal dependent phosphohydrolase n=1 Tax=Natronincola ferrireducens TaxID=393762 RepID=A0A1G9HE46_9FIRM|nr:HD-GYP domain-containing protein [Natronincola ferrireducens]SDL11250.1 metal dependent phosphohydrolase [Natronincola ferrireducens]
MLKINTSALVAGMILRKPIFDKEGRLLIDEGTSIKEFYIERLKNHRIETVYIDWRGNHSSEVEKAIIEETRREALNTIKNTVEGIQICRTINIEKLQQAIIKIIEKLIDNEDILIYLTDIKTLDDYTFGHSVNVCIFSLITGLALDFTKEDLEVLGIGALLHDIGKLHVPNTILNKPGMLTDEEYNEMKKHSVCGYEIVKNIKGLKDEIRWIIRDHHERYDGTGYPNKLWGKNIHIFPRIVAICDVYDALTSNRVYRKGIELHEAIEYLIAMGNHQFDYELVKVFLRHLSIYPVGTLVKLRSGEKGIVVNIHKDWPTRPIIKLVGDNEEHPIEELEEIDLTKHLSNSIVSILKAV